VKRYEEKDIRGVIKRSHSELYHLKLWLLMELNDN